MNRLLSFFCFLLSISYAWANPTADDLRPYYQDGQACVCIRFDGTVCNDIVWAGTYNGWSDNTRNLAKFQPVSGFKGWYVVSFNDSSNPIIGKPVQLTESGQFDWQYQTGDSASWKIISCDGYLNLNQWKEPEFTNIGTAHPTIAISKAWKNNPCPEPERYPKACSGTLPVLYINTVGNQPVVSKDEYLTATYYLDNLDLEGYQSIASDTLPDTLQIKGRGNWTWSGFEKKPYRLKLNKKQGLLGLKKNKHFALMAGADDNFSWLKNTLGYMLSRQLELEWTPGQAPVEVVLNGDYIGLYMLTELIRVDKDRVNIVEQADGCTQADSITGGWLVEIDNYEEPNRIAFTEPSNQWHGDQLVWITPKTPELLSTAQSGYLQSQMEGINTALYTNDESQSLIRVLDIEEAAKFYLVQELMSDCESYHGSCYLHKQMGSNEKWKFGPVWDFGNSFNNRNKYIYDTPAFSQVWIGQLASHPVFIDAVKRLWQHWLYYDQPKVAQEVAAFTALIEAAAVSDAKRWPRYDHAQAKKNHQTFLSMFNTHREWLTQDWGQGKPDDPTGIQVTSDKVQVTKFIHHGQIVIERNNQLFTIDGLLIQ